MDTNRLVLTAVVAAALAACATQQEAPPPAPAPAAKPAPAPAPDPAPAPAPMQQAQPAPKPEPKPQPKKPAVLNFSSTELFEFNKATLTPQARKQLDDEVVARLRDLSQVAFILVYGHADRMGSQQYNQRLSQRRADAVRAYLVSKGADGSKVQTLGFGHTQPVKSCPDQKQRKDLIECLAPNRRVVVEIQGTSR